MKSQKLSPFEKMTKKRGAMELYSFTYNKTITYRADPDNEQSVQICPNI